MNKKTIHISLTFYIFLYVLLIVISETIADPVDIPDPGLRKALEEMFGKKPGEIITEAELGAENFKILVAHKRNITDLTGLEFATNLQYVYLEWNSISDLSPLSELTSLEHLHLEHNQISDISPLSNFPALKSLNISYNNLTSLEGLPDLSLVYALFLQHNQITSIKPFIDHTEFTSVNDPFRVNVNLEGNPLDDDSANIYFPILFFDRSIDVSFTLTFMKKVSGDKQTASTNTTLQPFVIEVYNYKNEKLSGVAVRFELTSGSGSFVNGYKKYGYESFDSTTDADGKASATLTAGSTAGTYKITVSARIVYSRHIGSVGTGPFTLTINDPTPTQQQNIQQQDTTQQEQEENIQQDTTQQQEEETQQQDTTQQQEEETQQQDTTQQVSETQQDTTQQQETQNLPEPDLETQSEQNLESESEQQETTQQVSETQQETTQQQETQNLPEPDLETQSEQNLESESEQQETTQHDSETQQETTQQQETQNLPEPDLETQSEQNLESESEQQETTQQVSETQQEITQHDSEEQLLSKSESDIQSEHQLEPEPETNYTKIPFDYQWEDVGKVVISEIMLATLGKFPQWIELYNTTDQDIELNGWKIVGRYKDDLDAVHILESQVITMSITIKAKETLLLVSYTIPHLRDSVSKGISNKICSLQAESNNLCNYKGLVLELQGSEGNPIDRIGNLNDKDEIVWEIPLIVRNNRVSLIRRLKSVRSLEYNFSFGMKKFGWFPAENVKDLLDSNNHYFYGISTDIGTPGYRTESGEVLPVTLSSFRPQLNQDGHVSLSWITESELENAGFNILRSEFRKGPFVKVNPKLIQGAGTTGQRSVYSWTDTTAKPDVEYYYQLEDVTFSGERQTLTTKRIKGMISAKNRFVTQWGRLKSRH